MHKLKISGSFVCFTFRYGYAGTHLCLFLIHICCHTVQMMKKISSFIILNSFSNFTRVLATKEEQAHTHNFWPCLLCVKQQIALLLICLIESNDNYKTKNSSIFKSWKSALSTVYSFLFQANECFICMFSVHYIRVCCQETPENNVESLELRFQESCKPPLRVLEMKSRWLART